MESTLISPDILSHSIFTQGYYIIDDFLELKHYQTLRATAIELHEKGQFKSAKIGLKLNAQQDTNIRSDEICWLDDHATDPAIKAYLSQTKRIAQILNHSLFLGLFEFETHFAAYQPGSFYKKHVDQFATTQDRKLSCVYYLNNEWHQQYGGELNLYTTEDKLIRSISPQGNRFICFNSELPHEVCLTHQPRYSIAGWMKTRSLCLI